VLWTLLSAALLTLDWLTPVGFGVAALNAVLVLTAIWAPWHAAPALLAAWATVLTIGGHYLSPPNPVSVPWELPLVDRLAAIALLWISALLLLRYKSVEEQLGTTRARFRETYEKTAVGIAHVGIDGEWLMVNPCMAEILGYPDVSALRARSFRQLTHPEDRAVEQDHINRLKVGDIRTYTLEKRFIRQDATIVWVQETVSSVGDRRGGYLLYVIQDISERKRTEQHLTKLKAAVESANDAVVIGTPGGGKDKPMIEYVNDAFTRMFGYDKPDVIGKNPDLLCDPATGGKRPPLLFNALSTDESVRAELVGRTQTGCSFIAEWHVTGIRDATGVLVHWVAIIRDMTERHRIEQALKESEKRALRQLAELATLYHTAPIGLAMLSTELRYIKVNERLAEIDGMPAAAHIGKRPSDVVPRIADRIEPLIRHVLQTRQPTLDVEIEGETPKEPGVRRTWLQQFYPVLSGGGIEGVGIVVEEITEQKRGEQHLRFVMHELNHRVKNSLAVVQSMVSQTVRASGSLAEFEESLIGRIRALANTHTLLTESNWRSADLRHVVREAVRPYRHADGRNVDIKGPALALTPPASLALSMVMHELTTNAAKYGALSQPRGRVKIDWQVTSSDDGRLLTLRWRETGGPPVKKPERSGFGSQLIEFTIRHEFGGACSLDYREDGFVGEITIPWEKVTPPAELAATLG
jgi:PAS domain S-box-containing protein